MDAKRGDCAKLIVDVMGGDFAPHAILDGIQQALPELRGEIVLVGDEAALRPWLDKRYFRSLAEALRKNKTATGLKVRLEQASENIHMTDSIRAIRSKPDASINVGCKMAAQDWEARKNPGASSNPPSAFISAGHSGALMASAFLNMGRLRGIERPAIAIKLPTLKPDGCILLDVGANVDCKPEHLRDFAIMGAYFAQAGRKSPEIPKVALLSNGEEPSKGNELTRAALELLKKESRFQSGDHQVAHFVGYTEGKELLKGQVDVVVTDGFVGNVVLKSLEGLGSAVITLLKQETRLNPLSILGLLFAAGVLGKLKRKLDYAEYGAAPLLGIAGYAFVCHGRSRGKAIKNALLRCQEALKSHYAEHLESVLKGGGQ